MIAHDAKLEISKRKKTTKFKHVYTIMVKISHSKSSLNFKVWIYRLLSNAQSCDIEMFILISSKDVSFMMFMCKTKHWTKTMRIEMLTLETWGRTKLLFPPPNTALPGSNGLKIWLTWLSSSLTPKLGTILYLHLSLKREMESMSVEYIKFYLIWRSEEFD